MIKQEVISKLSMEIINSSIKCILNSKDLKYIWNHYKKTLGLFNNIDEFVASDEKLTKIIGEGRKMTRLKGVKDEIDKQLKRAVLNQKEGAKGLQPGILYECNVVLTLANILGFKSYKDLERGGYGDVPITLLEYVKSKEKTLCAARYVYFNEGDEHNFLIQYGNPKMGDGSVILMYNGIVTETILEIKDMPALLMDRDLIYDDIDGGKFIITDELASEFPDYIQYIERFNNETSIMEHLGRNYPLFNSENTLKDKQSLLGNFFNISNVDMLMVTQKEKLIPIKIEDLNYIFPDGKPLIDLSGSEIRTTGKNSKAVFTPNILNEVLNSMDISVIGKICRVYKDNKFVIGRVKGRGINKDTRYKINNIFFVSLKDNIDLLKQLEDNDLNYIEFPIDSIKQTKSGISLHINVKKSVKEIKEHLYSESIDKS